ncbi:MAG: hypothetical protein KGP14_12570 [Betaproteobacteria bacterium]|nr:hypothetical protein [Betaproteobacteria bacterium]
MGKPVDTLVNLSPVGLIYRGATGTDLANTQGMLDPPKPPDAASPDKNPLPAAPSVDNADTQARMAAAQQNEQNRRKRTATILTSAQGVLNQAPVAAKTLFGQ